MRSFGYFVEHGERQTHCHCICHWSAEEGRAKAFPSGFEEVQYIRWISAGLHHPWEANDALHMFSLTQLTAV